MRTCEYRDVHVMWEMLREMGSPVVPLEEKEATAAAAVAAAAAARRRRRPGGGSYTTAARSDHLISMNAETGHLQS